MGQLKEKKKRNKNLKTVSININMISQSYRGEEVLVRQWKTCVFQEEQIQISPSQDLSDSLKYLRWSATYFCTK